MTATILKPFGDKADQFAYQPPEMDARINILHGSVRSSKTWAMIPKVIMLCDYEVDGLRIFTGVSKQTIYDNVLNDLFDVIGPENYRYNRQSGQVEILGTQRLAIGAKDEGTCILVRDNAKNQSETGLRGTCRFNGYYSY
ncbi:MAG: hypothetical protein ABSC64_09320 [Candidatus Korobacteraceae bacterium]